MSAGRTAVKTVAVVAALALVATGAIAATGGFGGGAKPGEPLARESMLTPDELGDGTFDGLQYADPSDGLALVEAPEASSDGSAQLSYPILVPQGRGMTPELSIDYTSSTDSSWAGAGWDLGLDTVEVDTSFGVPYFDPAKESESYSLDGSMLVPNALGDAWTDRIADRQDFTRQVETEYEQIIRHGDGPKNYWWEVRDKMGGIRWYGAVPDAGGPMGGPLGVTRGFVDPGPNVGALDPDSVVVDDDGNIVKWLLSAKRDVGVNMFRYEYDTLRYRFDEGSGAWVADAACVDDADTLCARHTYPRSIFYTEAAEASDENHPVEGYHEEPPYEIRFIRMTERTNPSTNQPYGLRMDTALDATGRYLDLLAEQLASVEVWHGDLEVDGGRVYDRLATRYDLGYATGPFGKTLLSTVTQGAGTAAAVTHTFEYFNEVQDAPDSYAGFATDPTWDTGDTGDADDIGDRAFLDENISGGALGGAESNSAEGHVYVGFNPAVPQKVGSFGASIQIGGGQTDGIEELIDLNGDGLPDKVWKQDGQATASAVWYRLNLGGPDGEQKFSEPIPLTTLSGKGLSRDHEFQLQVALEAHIIVTASFGVGGAVAWGDVYFTDANADGLPDLVHEGAVYFNRLTDGVPTFLAGSTGTPVPLADGGMAPEVNSAELDLLQQRLQEASPPIDTVRRWVAPFDGTVSVEGAALLDPVASATTDDGVRVAIQLNEEQEVAETLAAAGDHAFDTPTVLDVQRGDRVYFRVGSLDNGANDEVAWSPQVVYTAIDGAAVVDEGSVDPVPDDTTEIPLDVNGLSQTSYNAAADFTLSGRPNTRVVMPYDGTVRFTATVVKSKATSDDLEVVLDRTDADPLEVIAVDIPDATGVPEGGGAAVPIVDGVIPEDFVGTIEFQAEVTVSGPVAADPDVAGDQPETDSLHTHLEVDSTIDLSAISWNPAIHYTDATDTNGDPIEVQKTIEGVLTDTKRVELAPEIEQYPNRSTAQVSEGWVADETTEYDELRIEHAALSSIADEMPSREVVLTIKTRDGLEWKRSVTLAASAEETVVDLTDPFTDDEPIGLEDGEEYWFELSAREPALSDALSQGSVTVTLGEEGASPDDVTPPVALTWTGRQGIFPLAYRGWGIAGYTASGALATAPIDEDAFVIDEDAQQAAEPAGGFDDLCTGPVTECEAEADIDPSYAYLPLQNPDSLGAEADPIDAPQWRGTRDNLAASADRARSSRLSSDTASLGLDEGGAADGVTRISVTGPSLSLAFGFGPLGGSVGVGPSWSLVDYEDLNGDGYPDVITPEKVQYTSQRGILYKSVDGPSERRALVNQDLTINASGGLDAGLVDIAANNKGKTNTSQGNAASKGGKAADSDPGLGAGFGLSIGGGFDLGFTNPNESGPAGGPLSADYGPPAEASDIPEGDGTAPMSQELADVNGDGLPDVVYTNPSGVFVRYNLGYDFADAALPLATGGFNTQESIGGHASAGFATPWGEFSGGLSFNWNYDMTRFAWIDVNGDGIPDRLHKASAGGQPTVEFGTGSGLAPAVDFGDFARASGVGVADLGASPQVSYDRSQGIGGGVDFTVYAGPLCLVACYLVVNPGASYQNSVSFSEVTLEDIDGDGFVDSLASTDDHEVQVQRNTTGRTNLLSAVRNPLGGTVGLDYERYGNTVDHPDSTWALSRVAVDDGRPGDGVDVSVSTFDYENPRFDRLFRQSLGFSKVTERELDPSSVAKRITETEYLNDNVFVAGLQTSMTVRDGANDTALRAATLDWGIRDVQGVPGGFDPLAEADLVDVQTAIPALSGTESLTWSFAPLVTDSEERYFAADGTTVGNETSVSFVYDGLGNVLEQLDEGELETDADDVLTVTDYSDCRISASEVELDDNGDYDTGVGCFGDTPYYPMPTDEQASPIFSPDVCPTWVSVPAVITMYDSDGEILRQRDGRDSVCDNQSVTLLEERISADEVAVTELQYDSWGSYNRIVYPEGEGGVRYAVEYIYDTNVGHANIAEVSEYDFDSQDEVDVFLDYEPDTDPDPLRTGMTSTATFDWSSGKVASRTDANDNTTSYTYDDLSRLASISNPLQAGAVTFEYHPSAPGYGYAIARHADAFNADPIETVQFADGIGRITQQKRDARTVNAQGVALEGRVVSGAVVYDLFGHEAEVYRPTFDTVAQTVYETATSPAPTKTTHEFNLLDQETVQTEPGARVTATTYGFGDAELSGHGVDVQQAVSTDPRGRVTTTSTDIRGNELRMDDQPLDPATPNPLDLLPPKTATYEYNPLGELLQVVDVAGNATTHTYDGVGNKLTTDTPDGGLVETWFDAEGKVIKEVSPTLREEDVETTYHYELQNLVKVDYPEDTPDVTYTYGEVGADGNGAGRIVQIDDAARVVTLEYDALGNTTNQLSEIKLHNWKPGDEKFQWTTEWVYDGLSRISTMTYPDGEVLTYDYDAGGLTKSVVGDEPGLVRVPQLDADGNPMFDADGNPLYVDEPTTWHYDYVTDRRYDEFLTPAAIDYGNGATTSWTYEPLTRWLSNVRTVSADRPLKGNPVAYREVQDQSYTYDAVGNPKTYSNNVPATVTNLFGSPVSMTYTYDPYDRLTFTSGSAAVWKNTRSFTFDLDFDDAGNVEKKAQVDKLGSKVQAATSYSFTRTFDADGPHQVSTQGQDTFHYDADGELIQIVNGTGKKAKITREITWNWAGKMELVDEYGQTTEYAYDDAGRRVIERGPNGEHAFINPWVTVRNGTELTKQIWIDDELIAQQRDPGDDPYAPEGQRYFLHKDLQGSTNVVTDAGGQAFQHQEYFPTGEVWIDEHSTVYRTAYQYAGAYTDERRSLIDFGERWYDARRELFLTVDPALSEPFSILEAPELQASYAYAGSNAIRYTDPSGALFTIAKANDIVRAAWDKSDAAGQMSGFGALGPLGSWIDAGTANHLPTSFATLGAGMDRAAAKKWQDTAEMFDPNPLIDIDLGEGTVKLGAPYGKRAKFGGTDAAATAKPVGAATGNATSGGTPAVNSSQSSSAAGTSSGAGGIAKASGTPKPLPATPTKAKQGAPTKKALPTPPTKNGTQPSAPNTSGT
ncbi:toxin TcdB middle/N-terminal domain-containing protein [Agromyces cerinus]|uniref:RHS repeat-associated core domain-containing protein n=1 Tax=Agromyces cerinus subsp. cerinus TaxID=232089 RepID=A0A1N6ESW0_9MICO|nr:toxin TcdB middle/N-terminal domain-containing protein [Agromyces cerinus]SIN86106.1 RHS repeat-associated core domain-containing protein [Agromyces cerinus subsp. cerinus]